MIGDILQPTHLLFVLVVALLVLGPKRLPEAGRALGKGIRDFRSAMSGEEDRHSAISADTTPAPAPPAPAQASTTPATQPDPPAQASTTPATQPDPPAQASTAPATQPDAPAQPSTGAETEPVEQPSEIAHPMG